MAASLRADKEIIQDPALIKHTNLNELGRDTANNCSPDATKSQTSFFLGKNVLPLFEVFSLNLSELLTNLYICS